MNMETVGRPMEILLVEDNLEDAGEAIRALREGKVQCRVSLVRDGQEALDFLHRRGVYAHAPHPDLILLDLKLPKRSGREVLAEIRSPAGDFSHVPVVVMTSSAVHEDILRSEQLAVESYMVKPVDLAQFLRVVRELRRFWLAEVILPVVE